MLACTGFRFDASIFDKNCVPELIPNGALPLMTGEWESINIKNLYYAGVLTGVTDNRKYFSSFISGYRYNIRFLNSIFEIKYHDGQLQKEQLECDAQLIADKIIDRISYSSALLLQQGYFCDLIVKSDVADTISYYIELPVNYVRETDFGIAQHYYIITLEYGQYEGDALCIQRDPDPEHSHKDAYIHPIIRHYKGHDLVDEYHAPENLENDWTFFQSIRTSTLKGNEPVAFHRDIYKSGIVKFLNKYLA